MVATKENEAAIREQRVGFKIANLNIFVYSSFEEIMPQWKDFEVSAPSTIYQTYAWQKAWQDTIGKEEGAKPLLVTAAIDENIVFLLPLIVVKKSGLVTACFMGGDHANYKFSLCDPNHFAEICAVLPQLLEKIATLKSPAIDVFDLTRVPLQWDGFQTPLPASFAHSPSPENGGSVSMANDFDAVLAYGNAKRKRKILRAQERALAALGGYEFYTIQGANERLQFYQLFLEQKKEWFAQRGINNPFDDDATTAFFDTLSQETENSGDQLINYTALKANGEILGIIAYGEFKGQNFGYFTSMRTLVLALNATKNHGVMSIMTWLTSPFQ